MNVVLHELTVTQRAAIMAASTVLVLLCGSVLVSIYRLGIQASDIHRRYRAIRALAAMPPIYDVSNTEIVDESLYAQGNKLRDTAKSEGALLVLVGTSSCRFCGAAWDVWSRATETSFADAEVSISYVVLDEADIEMKIPASLVQRLVTIRRPRDGDIALFSARTGVQVVPIGLVVRQDSRLACAVSGVPLPEQLTQCAEATVGNVVRTRGSLFFRNPDTREFVLRPPTDPSDSTPVSLQQN